MKHSDLLNFLAALPKTVCSIELGFLDFLDGNWHGLLNGIRETLCWHQQENIETQTHGWYNGVDAPGGIWHLA